MYFTDGVLACLVAESFEWTDEPLYDESSTQMSDELGSGSPGRGVVNATQFPLVADVFH